MAMRIFPKWDGTHGGKLAIWAKNIAVIKEMIAKYGLDAIRVKVEIIGPEKAKIPRVTGIKWPKIPFPGIPVPHLHFEGKIYPVSAAQWKQFSDGLVKEVAAKLTGARAVTAEALAALAEVGGGVK